MFFKGFRGQLKAGALVSHLEHSLRNLKAQELWTANHHLSDACKALTALRKASTEDQLSFAGWKYVADICFQLTWMLTAQEQENMARDAKYVFDFASQRLKELNEEEAKETGERTSSQSKRSSLSPAPPSSSPPAASAPESRNRGIVLLVCAGVLVLFIIASKQNSQPAPSRDVEIPQATPTPIVENEPEAASRWQASSRGLSGSGLGFRRSLGSRNARWSAARAITFLGGAIDCAWWSTKGLAKSCCGTRTTLELQVRPETDATERERVLQRWYRQYLRDAVPPLIAKWEAILDVQITGWGIKKMKTKWGACSVAARRIWLNLELAKKPVQCLEYLIVHELIHLIEPHHNERFISLLDQHLPNWRMHRQELNAAPLAHNTWSY